MPQQQAMSGKEKRMMEAARLRYMEDCTNQEIADRLGLKETTIKSYFSEDDMDQFKRFYSDRELFKLQQSLEQDIKDGEDLANDLLSRAISHEEVKPSTLVRASKQALDNRKKKVELLQELGIIKKPKERKEVEKTSKESQDVMERLQEAYEEMEADKQEAEQSAD